MAERTLFDDVDDTALPEPPKEASGIGFPLALAALSSVSGVGSRGLKKLATALNGDLGQLFHLSADEIIDRHKDLRVPGLAKLAQHVVEQKQELLDAGQKRLEVWEKCGIRVVPHSALPERLKAAAPNPPQWLFTQGDQSLLARHPAIAVVGTRDPSEDGLRATQVLVRYLAVYPVTIVSGLAEGIDHKAHDTALDLNLPNVAFLGHGINVVFPVATAKTRTRILEQGGLLASEYLPDDHYQKAYFVERNRLQAALADLVVPVEAKENGGTAHTVRYALQYQRPIMGVRFAGANGILDKIKPAGGLIFDMQSQGGERLVDRTVRGLVARAGQDSYPFKHVEDSLARIIQEREATPDQIRRLLQRLQDRLLGE